MRATLAFQWTARCGTRQPKIVVARDSARNIARDSTTYRACEQASFRDSAADGASDIARVILPSADASSSSA